MTPERKKWLEENWERYKKYLPPEFEECKDCWHFCQSLINIHPALADLKAEMEATP